MKKTRVLLGEDTRMSRGGIAAMISGADDMKVVASFAGDDDPLVQVRRLKPHVVLLDLGLRSQNDLHVLSALTKGFPDIKVISLPVERFRREP